MKRELDEALCKDFPLLYAQRGLDMRQTAMCWGFDCGDGWEPLIRRLSEALEAINRTLDPSQAIQATQVKEKYGTLRFYTNHGSDEVWALIEKAEAESGKTCDLCGKPGQVGGEGGWLSCRCPECAPGGWQVYSDTVGP